MARFTWPIAGVTALALVLSLDGAGVAAGTETTGTLGIPAGVSCPVEAVVARPAPGTCATFNLGDVNARVYTPTATQVGAAFWAPNYGYEEAEIWGVSHEWYWYNYALWQWSCSEDYGSATQVSGEPFVYEPTAYYPYSFASGPAVYEWTEYGATPKVYEDAIVQESSPEGTISQWQALDNVNLDAATGVLSIYVTGTGIGDENQTLNWGCSGG